MVYVLVGVPAAALLIGVLVTWRCASGQGWRWGWVAHQVEVGAGAYRSAPVEVREARRPPPICSVAAATSVAWGLLNVAVFAPLGLLMAWGFMHASIHRGPLAAFGMFGLLVASCNAFRLGVRLVGLVRPLVVRTRWSATEVNDARFVSTWHHSLVTVSFALLTAALGLDLMLPTMIPCAVGFAHVALLWRARVALSRADHEDRERAVA